MSEKPPARYMTTDVKLVTAFKSVVVERDAWNAKAEAIGKRLGREAQIGTGFGGARLYGFARKPTEPIDPKAYAKTPWILDPLGCLRPRLSTSEGKKLAEKMRALGKRPHAVDILVGIPKMSGFLGTPEVRMTPDGKGVVASYTERVRHDARWRPLSERDYWSIFENKEAAPRA